MVSLEAALFSFSRFSNFFCSLVDVDVWYCRSLLYSSFNVSKSDDILANSDLAVSKNLSFCSISL